MNSKLPLWRARPKLVYDPATDMDSAADWDGAEYERIPGGAALAPATSEMESFPDIDTELIDQYGRLYMKFGADVQQGDRVKFLGTTWSVESRRADWANPYTGDLDGATVRVRVIAGE